MVRQRSLPSLRKSSGALSDRGGPGVFNVNLNRDFYETTMIKHKDSHLDHNLTEAHVDHILQRFADRQAFFIDTFTLPRDLGTVPCGLYGPLVGDPPIGENEVCYAPRGTRSWPSRLMVDGPPRQQHEVTVIAGPHEEPCPQCTTSAWNILHRADCPTCGGTGNLQHACILYTAYGGPLAPQEPDDPGCKDVPASKAFWAEHGLSR